MYLVTIFYIIWFVIALVLLFISCDKGKDMDEEFSAGLCLFVAAVISACSFHYGVWWQADYIRETFYLTKIKP